MDVKPILGVVPDSEHVFVLTAGGWVAPDDYTIDYDTGTIIVTHSATFTEISVKFDVKQPPLHPDP